MARATLDVELRLGSTVIVRPGDTLVVARTDDVTDVELDELMTSMTTLLPGVEVVVVNRCTGLAVYRPDADADR